MKQLSRKLSALEHTFLLYLFILGKEKQKTLLVSASCSQNPEEKLFGNGLSTKV